MNPSDNNVYKPVNEPIQPHSQVSSCIEILDFDEMTDNGEISKIQVMFERIGQEIYQTRKKNYSWGFRIIEPEFLNFSERIVLISKLFKEEHLFDLNSVIFHENWYIHPGNLQIYKEVKAITINRTETLIDQYTGEFIQGSVEPLFSVWF